MTPPKPEPTNAELADCFRQVLDGTLTTGLDAKVVSIPAWLATGILNRLDPPPPAPADESELVP